MSARDGHVCTGLVPFVKELLELCNQVWFADDASGADKFARLRRWFDAIVNLGPRYGYFVKAEKCTLLPKPDRVAEATAAFKGTNVGISTDGSKDSGVEVVTTGARHLGAAVGTRSFQEEYVRKKVHSWVD